MPDVTTEATDVLDEHEADHARGQCECPCLWMLQDAAALAPDAVVVTQRELEERLAALAHELKWCKDDGLWHGIAHDEDSETRPTIARYLLGLATPGGPR